MFIFSYLSRIKNNKLFFSSYLSFVSWLIPSVLALVVPIFLISSIGEDGYGTYALLVSIAGYFTIADLSLDAFLIPKISSNDKNNNALIDGAKTSFILISIIVLIVSLILLNIFRINNILGLKEISSVTILFFGLYSASQLLLTVSYIIASGTQKLNLYNKKILYTNLLYVLTVFVLKYIGILTIESLIFTRLFANMLAVIDIIWTKSLLYDFKSVFIIFNKETLLFTKYSLLGKAISYASFNFDKIVLASFLTLHQVGIIAFPMQLGLAVVMGASRFCIPLLPISGEHINNFDVPLFDNTILHFIDIVLLFIGFCVSLLIIWIPFLLPHIYSSQIDLRYVQTPFSLIIIGFWMISWSSIPANVLPGWGKMKLNVFSSAIRAILIFAVMLILINNFEILSVGISILIGGLWEVLFLFWFLKKNQLYSSFQRALKLSLIVFIILISAIFINSFNFHYKYIFSLILTLIFFGYLLYNFRILKFKKKVNYEKV